MQFYLLCRSSLSLHSSFNFAAQRPAVAFIDWLSASVGVTNAPIDNCIKVNALLEVVMSE
jgi:hypothetical protein